MNAYKKIYILLIVAFLILIAAIAAVLVSCIGSARSENPDGITTASEHDFIAYFGTPDDGIFIEEAVSAYEEQTGIKIETIVSDGNERAVRRLLNSDDPPAVYVLPSKTGASDIVESDVLTDLSNTLAGTENGGLPWNALGFGLVADKRLMAELAGGANADTYLADMRAANYTEWATFITGLDVYIRNGTPEPYTLNGKNYTFPAKKGARSAELNGVYSVAGGDSSLIVGRLMSVVFSGLDTEEIAVTSSDDTVVEPVLDKYTATFEAYTATLAGRFAPGIRGTDFINKEKYSKENAEKIFTGGKAAFLLADSDAYDDIRKLNAEMAEDSVMLPLKTLSAKSPGSILTESRYRVYANEDVSEREKTEALDFARWLSEYRLEHSNALEKSVASYCVSGDIIEFPGETKQLENFEENVYKNDEITALMADPVWDAAKRAAFSAALSAAWDGS
ncbi:MAG: extracellular solute-binding protein [Clostridiales Family XIII bacterium]|jgi:hypothetical protein|nr:extracellular solute-binding protein [Clostridiales Family XIII bacterium]